MRLAKSISLERTRLFTKRSFFSFLLLSFATITFAQNSPYSLYGLGDQLPTTNILTRGMGSLSAAYRDGQVINFNNPASYSAFLVATERTSREIASGRVVFDVGINIDNRTLRQPNNANKFSSSNGQFSYIQIGAPLRKNWGLSFGLRQLTRVGYNITRNERIKDPGTGLPIDSVITQFQGDGGAFLPSIGTGVSFGKFSAGVNLGYLFGKKEIGTRRAFINDTINYQNSVHETNYSFGDLFFNAGLQYSDTFNNRTALTVGISGNWKQDIKGRQDIRRASFIRGASGEEFTVDSVFQQNDVDGTVTFPAMFNYGITINNLATDTRRGWTIGTEFLQKQWDEYRFFGARDSVQNSWEVRFGTQLTPNNKAFINNRYGQLVSYRAGFFIGRDYITAGGDKLPLFGASFGLGLPVWNFKDPGRFRRSQYSNLNLSFEYIRRGNDDNRLKENMFRISAGFNFSDWWFSKRKYD